MRAGILPLLLAVTAVAAAGQSPQYVGSELCLACHPDQAAWRNSAHATTLKSVADDTFSLEPKKGIIADRDGNRLDDFKQGLDFNKVSSAFNIYRPNAPVLRYDSKNGYRIRIGSVDFPVRFAYGGNGSSRQLYVVKIPALDRPGGLSAGHYVSPVQYNEVTNQYVASNPQYWYNPDNSPRITQVATTKEAPEGASFEKNCAGCHFTGISVGQDANGEWVATAPPAVHYAADDPHYIDFSGDGITEHANTGCERCHGPGLEHFLSRGDPKKIISPRRDFTAKQDNELCGSCHASGKSLPSGTYNYPYDETARQPYAVNLGAELFNRFLSDTPSLWPAGTESRQYRQQLQDFRHAAMGQVGIRCSDCHDVHADNQKQIRRLMAVQDSTGNVIQVPVKVENNTLCLACHAGRGSFLALSPRDMLDPEGNRSHIATVVSEHTFHVYEPEDVVGRSRCTECHMAKVATNAVSYDTASHTFAVIRPEQTLVAQEQGGMPNACAVRCHRPWAPIFGLLYDSELTNWTQPSDVQLAEWLKNYYGPGGAWWQTRPEVRALINRTSPLPRSAGARSQ